MFISIKIDINVVVIINNIRTIIILSQQPFSIANWWTRELRYPPLSSNASASVFLVCRWFTALFSWISFKIELNSIRIASTAIPSNSRRRIRRRRSPRSESVTFLFLSHFYSIFDWANSRRKERRMYWAHLKNSSIALQKIINLQLRNSPIVIIMREWTTRLRSRRRERMRPEVLSRMLREMR